MSGNTCSPLPNGSIIELCGHEEPAELPEEGVIPAERIARALRSGSSASDRVFDHFLSPELRLVSGQYWTPLEVVKTAARWIEDVRAASVVDIGSGVGKFCVAGALICHAHFVGLEQRTRLVREAVKLARTYGVDDRVSFMRGALGEVTIPSADVYYLFNPFGENLFGPADHLDEDVELNDARYQRDVMHVERLLRHAPAGTHLITYNGFGGAVPPSYFEVRCDYTLPNVLRMWKKAFIPKPRQRSREARA